MSKQRISNKTKLPSNKTYLREIVLGFNNLFTSLGKNETTKTQECNFSNNAKFNVEYYLMK